MCQTEQPKAVKHKPLPPQKVAELRRLWSENVTNLEIVRLIGVGHQTVVRVARELGLPKRKLSNYGKQSMLEFGDVMPGPTAPWPEIIPDIPGYYEDHPDAR